ncbi:MAG: SRPBCC family protein [Betaproteobacteria bacterium]
MWSKSYSTTVRDLKADQVWSVWTDINQWHTWQDDIEYAKLDGHFETGNVFRFRPKGGPNINIELTKVEPQSLFVDLTRFPLARMYGSHELIDHGDRLEIKTTISIEGPLSFVWRKIVAENVANEMKEQTERLIEKTRSA